MSTDIIKCNNIAYRKGFIEVSTGSHPGCINIEAWDVHTDLDISTISIRDANFPEDDEFKDNKGNIVDPVNGNIELELNVDQARALVAKHQDAIDRLVFG